MTKKRTSIWIDPAVLRQLKMLGVQYDQPVGNVIEALVDFAGSAQGIADEAFQRRFKALFDTAMANGGGRATFDGDPPGAGMAPGMGTRGDDTDEP